jgi:hypothetical protein
MYLGNPSFSFQNERYNGKHSSHKIKADTFGGSKRRMDTVYQGSYSGVR